MSCDDSDMKIVGAQPDLPAADDTAEIASRLATHKANGNLCRARRLGAVMADEVSAVEGDHPSANAAYLTQRRILLAFAVEVGLDAFLPDNLLAQTAQSVFFDTLRLTAPEFYEDLQESGAFSFYYLCVRDGRQVEAQVGKTFASLCGRPQDLPLASEGQHLYTHFLQRVRRFTDSMGFVS